jgi:hypothetical protein
MGSHDSMGNNPETGIGSGSQGEVRSIAAS